MAYTSQQIADAVQASLNQGFTIEQVMQGAQEKFGVSPYEVANAAMEVNPGMYMQPDEITSNVNPWSNNGVIANDPRYQARHNVLERVANFLPDTPAQSPSPQLPPRVPPMQRPPQMPPANPMGLGQGTFSEMYGGYQASPWLSATADEIGRRTQDALGQSFNGIRSNAVGVGGLGGSRQGVAQGMATSNAIDSLQGNLANLFGQDWTQAQNRGLQARGQDQGFTLGLGSLANQRTGLEQNYELGLGQQALTGRGQDMSFFGQQRGQDLQQLGLGAEVYDMGVRGGWAPLTTAGGLFNTTAGNSVTQTSGGTQGGGWQGLLGGALGAGQYARNMGWW